VLAEHPTHLPAGGGGGYPETSLDEKKGFATPPGIRKEVQTPEKGGIDLTDQSNFKMHRRGQSLYGKSGRGHLVAEVVPLEAAAVVAGPGPPGGPVEK